jgi:hypothetical protein
MDADVSLSRSALCSFVHKVELKLVPHQRDYDIPRPRPWRLNRAYQDHFDGALVSIPPAQKCDYDIVSRHDQSPDRVYQ